MPFLVRLSMVALLAVIALPASAQITPSLVLRAVNEVCMAAHDDGMASIRARAVAAGFIDAAEAQIGGDPKALILTDDTTFIYVRDFGPKQSCSIQVNDTGPRSAAIPATGATDLTAVMTAWTAAQSPVFFIHRGLHRNVAADGTIESAWIRQTPERGDEVLLVRASVLASGVPITAITYQTQPMTARIPSPPGATPATPAAPRPALPSIRQPTPAPSPSPAPAARPVSRAETTRGPFRLVEADASIVRHMAGPRVTARPTTAVDRWVFTAFGTTLSTTSGRQDASAQLIRFDCVARTTQVLATEAFLDGRMTGGNQTVGLVVPEGPTASRRRLMVAACDPAAPIDGVAFNLATARRSAREMLAARQTYP